MSAFRLAVLHLLRRRVTTVITLMTIAIAVACAGTLLRIYVLSNSRFATMATGGDVLVGAKAGAIPILLGALNAEGVYPAYLPESLFRTLKEDKPVQFDDGVKAQSSMVSSITPLLYFATYKDYRAIGTDESFVHRPRSEGNLSFAQGDWVKNPGDLVVGEAVARRENLHLGDTVQLNAWNAKSSGAVGSMHVVGVLKATKTVWDLSVFASVEQAQSFIHQAGGDAGSIWHEHVLNYFMIYLRSPDVLPTLRSLINERTVGELVVVTDAKQELQELTGQGTRLGLLMGILILVLSSLAVAGVLIARFDGMMMQMAVLRAIGYGRRELAAWLVWEGLLLGSCACVLGALIDGLSFPFMKRALSSALPVSELVDVSLLRSAPVWGLALISTVFAVLIPLWRLYRQDVHAALKGQ